MTVCVPAAELGDVPHAELLLVVQLHLAAQLLLLAALGLAVRGNLRGYQVENIFDNPFLMVMKLFPMLSTVSSSHYHITSILETFVDIIDIIYSVSQ